MAQKLHDNDSFVEEELFDKMEHSEASTARIVATNSAVKEPSEESEIFSIRIKGK